MATNQKSFAVQKTEEEWRRTLTPEQYYVLREHGTERPGTCALLHEKRSGTFTCVGCGQPLFVADRKFESGTGWPSFFAPIAGAIETSVRPHPFHGADRGALQPLRRSPRSRVPRWAAADRRSILHQRRGAAFLAGRGIGRRAGRLNPAVAREKAEGRSQDPAAGSLPDQEAPPGAGAGNLRPPALAGGAALGVDDAALLLLQLLQLALAVLAATPPD